MDMKAFMNRTLHIFSLIICIALSVSAVTSLVSAYGRDDGNDSIIWSFDEETFQFTVENPDSICSDGDLQYGVVALYLEDGQQVSYGMAEKTTDGGLSVICSLCDLPAAYCIRFFFLDDFFQPVSSAETYVISTIAPTCTKDGYVVATSEDDTFVQILKTVPAAGHVFSDAVVQEPVDAANCGYRERHCLQCPFIEKNPIYPECTIARLCLYGDLTGIGKKSEVPVTVSFDGEGQSVDCYGLLKYQGHTSMVYDKKNYTLKLFKDAEHTDKNKLKFFDWKKEHKYILKANYIDASTCRNLVCADIWSEMVACRQGYHPRLDDSSNMGATDGFPLALYLNDEFLGLYTFTLHRDDDLFDMEDGQRDGILVANTAQSDSAFFKAPATFESGDDWEVEFSGTEDTTWAEDKLNALIEFVLTSSDSDFYENLDQHLDVNSALDYLIAIYSLGLTNSGAKNITLATYEDGVLFFSLCDMENAFGLSTTGESFYSPSEYLPECINGRWDSATKSLLWDRLLQAFLPELCSRYGELRQSILTADHICGKVADYMAPISQDFYSANQTLYPEMPQISIPHEDQIEAYVLQRLLLLDEIFLNNEFGST